MKKYLFSILFLCTAMQFTAQDSIPAFRIGIATSLRWCDRLMTAEESVSSMKEDFEKIEKGMPGYSAGLSLQYVLSKHWFLQSGIAWSSVGYRIDTLPEAGLIDLRYKFNYLEVPLMMNCVLGQGRKFHPIASAGLSVNYMVKQHSTFYREGISMEYVFEEAEKTNKLGYAANVGFGFDKVIYKNVHLNCLALLSQSLTATTDTPLKRYMNSAGIAASLNWSF